VIKELVRIRTMLEKMKSIDTKLSYQVNKLLERATMSGEAAAAVAASHEVEADPRTHRPMPKRLVANNNDRDDDDHDDISARYSFMTPLCYE
jgi:hypothetical protein